MPIITIEPLRISIQNGGLPTSEVGNSFVLNGYHSKNGGTRTAHGSSKSLTALSMSLKSYMELLDMTDLITCLEISGKIPQNSLPRWRRKKPSSPQFGPQLFLMSQYARPD